MGGATSELTCSGNPPCTTTRSRSISVSAASTHAIPSTLNNLPHSFTSASFTRPQHHVPPPRFPPSRLLFLRHRDILPRPLNHPTRVPSSVYLLHARDRMATRLHHPLHLPRAACRQGVIWRKRDSGQDRALEWVGGV